MSSVSGDNPQPAAIPLQVELLDYLPARLLVPPSGTRPIFGWGLLVLPTTVAVLCWPAFFAIFFVLSFSLALMAVAACIVWAWRVSDRLARWRYWLRVQAGADGKGAQPGIYYQARMRGMLFIGQIVGILSSCPLFWLALRLASRRGLPPQMWWVGRRFI